jgi:hypothetical protein
MRVGEAEQDLTVEVEALLAGVEEHRAALAAAEARGAGLEERRVLRAGLRVAYEEADRLLREATRRASRAPRGRGSYLRWSRWRHRLSTLDLAMQKQLFAEADDSGCLGLGSVRAVDTGMSGPDVGDLLHGQSMPTGAPARYGLDPDAVIAGRPQAPRTRAEQPVAPASPLPSRPPAPTVPEAA